MSKIIMAEGAAPDTPSTGKGAIFIDSSGRLSLKDDDGNTDTMAVLATNQTFTAAQSLIPTDVAVVPLTINMPASTSARAMRADYNSTESFRLQAQAAISQLFLLSRDMGNNVPGAVVQAGRNTSGGAVGPAAGTIQYITAAGNSRFTWVDAAGDVRVHSAAPTGSTGAPTVSDTAGVVIGTQSSWIKRKENLQKLQNNSELLDEVLQAELYSYQLKEDSQQNADGSKPVYKGLVITEADREANAWFANNLGPQQTPVLNERNLFGYLIGSIQAQQTQIEELRKEIAELKARF